MTERATTTGQYAIGWFLTVVIVYGSLAPSTPETITSVNDKLQHFGAYFVTMAWFAAPVKTKMECCMHAAFLVLLTVMLEYAQLLAPGRTFELADIAFGTAGVAMAVITTAILSRWTGATNLADREYVLRRPLKSLIESRR